MSEEKEAARAKSTKKASSRAVRKGVSGKESGRAGAARSAASSLAQGKDGGLKGRAASQTEGATTGRLGKTGKVSASTGAGVEQASSKQRELFQSGEGAIPLVDELGAVDLKELVFGAKGRLFFAAGRLSPVAEFTDDFVVLHAPGRPLADPEKDPHEDIVEHADKQGILLDDLGERKKIVGCTLEGHQVYWLGERKPGTLKHYAGWMDHRGRLRKVLYQNQPLTTEAVYRLRNRTHDGEIGVFPDIASQT